jgi:hypothetical protein
VFAVLGVYPIGNGMLLAMTPMSGVAVGSIGSEEKFGFAIHCHGVKRTACPAGEQRRGGETQI